MQLGGAAWKERGPLVQAGGHLARHACRPAMWRQSRRPRSVQEDRTTRRLRPSRRVCAEPRSSIRTPQTAAASPRRRFLQKEPASLSKPASWRHWAPRILTEDLLGRSLALMRTVASRLRTYSVRTFPSVRCWTRSSCLPIQERRGSGSWLKQRSSRLQTQIAFGTRSSCARRTTFALA